MTSVNNQATNKIKEYGTFTNTLTIIVQTIFEYNIKTSSNQNRRRKATPNARSLPKSSKFKNGSL